MTTIRILSFAISLFALTGAARAEIAVPAGDAAAEPGAVSMLERLVASPPHLEDGLPFAGVFEALVSSINPPELVSFLTEPSRIAVTVYNVNSHETATFHITPDGVVAPDEVEHLKSFFMCRRTRRRKEMDAGVLAILADLGKQYPGRVIEVISGYRAPPYGARRSKHFRGHAIDLRVRGVKTHHVRDYLWSQHRSIGLGHYHRQNFLHVDHRPDEKDTAWTARHEGASYVYNPRWARKIRRDEPTIAWR